MIVRVRSLAAPAVAAALVTMLAAGCIGAGRIRYLDSSRTGGGAKTTTSIAGAPAAAARCPHGVARLISYASLGDRVLIALSGMMSDRRHVDVVCAGGQ